MSRGNLREVIALAREGALVEVAPGEYQGPWNIDRPVRLVGVGRACVLWASQGPVLRIKAPGVTLQGLSIEVTDEADGIALLIEGPAQAHPPVIQNIHIRGRVEGWGTGRRWRLPTVIDLGRVAAQGQVSRMIGLDVSGPVNAATELVGLTVQVKNRPDGGLALSLTLNGADLTAGTLLDGKVEIEAAGLSSPIRLIGQVVEGETGSPGAPPGSALDALMDDRHIGTAERAPVPRASPHSPLPSSPPDEQPSWEESFLVQARSAVQAGKIDQAVELLVQAIKVRPRALNPHCELARLYEKQGNFTLAVEEWKQILALVPGHSEARLQLISGYNQLNHFALAIELAEQALRDPQWANNSDLYRALGMAYSKTGSLPQAIWAIGKAIELCKDPRQRATLSALHLIWEREANKS